MAVLCAAQAPVSERVQFADGLFSRGLFGLARQEYESLLVQAAPDVPRDVVLFRLAECHRELGNKRGAEQAYRTLMESLPDSPYRFQAAFRRAELYVAGAQFAEAETLYRALIAQDPPEDILASSRYFLGYCVERQGRSQEAEAAYRSVVEGYPSSPYASYAGLALARLLQAQPDRREEAEAFLASAAEQSATPRVAAESWFLRGDAAYASGDFAAAASAYHQLLNRFPNDRRAREARLQAGWSFYHDDRLEEAGRMADAVLSAAPVDTRPEWLYLRANCRRRLNDAPGALADYRTILRDYPDHEKTDAATYEQLLVRFQQGDYAGVVRDGASSSPAGAFGEDLGWLLVESFIGLNRLSDAEQRLEQLAAGYPRTERAPVALFRLARMHHDRKAFREAGRLYRQVTETFPENPLAPEALAAAAHSEAAGGAYDQALADWNHLVRSYPDSERMEEALYQKALTELHLEDPESAVSLRRLLTISPRGERAAEAHYWLGVLAEKTQDPVAAEAALRKALALSPPPALTHRIQFRLAGVLQGLGRAAEAADLVQGLLDTELRREMSPSLLEWLATVRLTGGDFVSAERVARILAEEAPSPGWAQIGWTLAGDAARSSGNLSAAAESYRKAVSQPTQSREGIAASVGLAELALDAGRLDSARDHFSRAAELADEPDLARTRARCYLGLGDVARLQGDWEEAIRRYLSVGILFDDADLTPQALYRAAEGFAAQKMTAEQRSTAEELTRRYPNSPWTRKLNEEP